EPDGNGSSGPHGEPQRAGTGARYEGTFGARDGGEGIAFTRFLADVVRKSCAGRALRVLYEADRSGPAQKGKNAVAHGGRSSRAGRGSEADRGDAQPAR